MEILIFSIVLIVAVFVVFLVFKNSKKTYKHIEKTIPKPKKGAIKNSEKERKNNKNFNQKVKVFFKNKRERS